MDHTELASKEYHKKEQIYAYSGPTCSRVSIQWNTHSYNFFGATERTDIDNYADLNAKHRYKSG